MSNKLTDEEAAKLVDDTLKEFDKFLDEQAKETLDKLTAKISELHGKIHIHKGDPFDSFCETLFTQAVLYRLKMGNKPDVLVSIEVEHENDQEHKHEHEPAEETKNVNNEPGLYL